MVRFTAFAIALLIVSVSIANLRADSADPTTGQQAAVVPADEPAGGAGEGATLVEARASDAGITGAGAA